MKDDRVLSTYIKYAHAAGELLAEQGWRPFGYYSNTPRVLIEFSKQLDEDGLPFFERVIGIKISEPEDNYSDLTLH